MNNTKSVSSSSKGQSGPARGTGDQLHAPGGTVNQSKGHGNHFPGAIFNGPVNIGTGQQPILPRDCWRLLAFPEMDSRFNDIDAAAIGTCNWVSQHKVYMRWAASNRGLLWIQGKPGCGKSTLLQYILSHFGETANAGEEALTLSFFFHGRGTELQRTPLGLFRSLLYQLRDVPDALSDVVDTFQQRCETVGKHNEKWQWHLQELQKFFGSSLQRALKTRPIWLFVDALDECGRVEAKDLADFFKLVLKGLPSAKLKDFHICFTCRHYPNLVLDGVFELCVEKENGADISTFVEGKLSSFRKRTSSTLPDLIMKRANGVFLWASLVVTQVLDLELEGAGLKHMEHVILSVPEELNALYFDLVQKMPSNSGKLIQWICFAMRPLSLDELRWAMLVEADNTARSLHECEATGDYPSDDEGMKRRVQALTRGLAEVTTDTKVVQFIHQSVKEFFASKGLSALSGAISLAAPNTSSRADFAGMAHCQISRTCIRYLKMSEITGIAIHSGDGWTSTFPLLSYATMSWVAHAKQSEKMGISQDDLLEYFAWPSEALVQIWVRVYNSLEIYSDECPPGKTTMLHIVSRHGLIGVVQIILRSANQLQKDIDAKDESGRTALSYAAENGHESVVMQLLGAGKVGIRGWAKAILWTLLKQGVNVDAEDVYGRTPLLFAAKNGHEAIVSLLLEKRANVNAPDGGGGTPISWAAQNGHKAIVQLLLGRGANVNGEFLHGRAPLSWAAEAGHEAIVKLLLDNGADIDARDIYGSSPLGYAARYGHNAIVKLLLENSAKIHAEDMVRRTPLWYAVVNGHIAVVKLLLENGANAETRYGHYGQTALCCAALNGHEGVVQLLLERNVNVNVMDTEGRTPLLQASWNGYEFIVKLLLESSANVDIQDNLGRTPLFRATEEGHEAIVKLLLQKGANINLQATSGQTPLLLATGKGHKGIVKLLLEKGANINTQSSLPGIDRPLSSYPSPLARSK
ncbi:ankyrin repeats (3 copies) domain-containing protein [Penicillium cataractarum]|uniref:protein S-acyltransferase n=1 Tax=Penicillium cataractarum TaxID=2100454 RepID=A0A9W9VX70_9EURO|nr:ankyrin repeats (3 copies) domain-containing protein [Penicillium cataractarum]KAJ5390819.1 ankyrin repeats (3 copies) domain-containing protein [Penicillium cataractarum]